MSGTLSIDFGDNVPGESGVLLTGTTLATAYLLRKQVTVIEGAVAGAMVLLPSSYASGTDLQVKNRTNVAFFVSPGTSNQIENNGIGNPVDILAGDDLSFVSFDPPASPAPRTWWLTTGSGGSVGTDGDIELESRLGRWLFADGTAIQWGGGSAGGSGVFVASAPPAFTVNGQLWWDTVGGQLYIEYNDGVSTQWVAASSIGANGAPPPAVNLTATNPSYLLTTFLSVFTTVAPGTSVIIPSGVATWDVWNAGANNLQGYPPVGAQFETFGTNNPVTIAPGGRATFVVASSTQVYAR